MVERAYSIEKSMKLNAKEAQKYSLEGELNDPKAFTCCDEACHIPLTCTNFKNPKGKRFFYTPSCKEELHNIDCSEISQKERKEQIENEKDKAKSTIEKDGTIRMVLSPNKTKSTLEAKKENAEGELVSNNSGNVSSGKSTKETRNMYSVASFVGLYKDPSINNEDNCIRIGKELISLTELFKSPRKRSFQGPIRIYFGKGMIKTASFNKDIIEITFSECPNEKIYSNRKRLMRQNSEMITKHCDKSEELTIYFRGNYGEKEEKKNKLSFLPFHENQIYKDLYFE
ncbi:hypothetical protein FQS96_14155 [Enterococcus faecalis]|uniref:hypothetical protein n=1 Tax=Enterococcus TaxID=1350 RepID=UPI001A97D021|nr:hypothetical protein [Enterococcus faecalis]MBO1126580.1 hypothetical protein [Enterococcus faecalis]